MTRNACKEKILEEVEAQASRCQAGDFMTVTEPYILVRDLQKILQEHGSSE